MELWDLFDENRRFLYKQHNRQEPLAPGHYHVVAVSYTHLDVYKRQVFTVIFGFMDHDNDITFHRCCGNAHKHSSGKSRPGIWKSSDTVHRYSLWSDRSCLLQQI